MQKNDILFKYNEFNELLTHIHYGYTLQYGIIKGNNTILLIKPGQDGSLVGYKDKYYNLAKYINKKFGYTVICCNNPYDKNINSLEDAINVIEEYVKENKFDNYQIYYLGNSNGGVLGARYSYLYPNIKRLLLINPPLFFSYHKLKDGILKFRNEKIVFLYGSLDPSYKYVGLLDLIENDKISYDILKNEDHNLSSNNYSLEYLVKKYLINN